MRIVKLALISVVFFFLLLTGISLLLPSTINVSRAIDINAPASVVYKNIYQLQNWKNWYAEYDSTKATFSGTSEGKGATITMDKTKVTVTEATADKIKAIWMHGESKPLPGEFNFITQGAGEHMTLQWNFSLKLNWYPWEKFASITSDKALGPFMEKSLDKLKVVSENP